MPANCLYWRGDFAHLACIDDLCHGSDTTLCGLERGIDFDQVEEWEEDDRDYCPTCDAVPGEPCTLCDDPVDPPGDRLS